MAGKLTVFREHLTKIFKMYKSAMGKNSTKEDRNLFRQRLNGLLDTYRTVLKGKPPKEEEKKEEDEDEYETPRKRLSPEMAKRSELAGLSMEFTRSVQSRNQLAYTLKQLEKKVEGPIKKQRKYKKVYTELYEEWAQSNKDVNNMKKYGELLKEKPHYKDIAKDKKYGINAHITDKMMQKHEFV
jgi:hypothetical protein